MIASVAVPATGVTLDKTTLNLMTGETAVLTAAAQPENTTDTLTWTTGNEAVATVADGVVTAVGAGSTVITAACGSVKAECAVTVTASPLTVSVGGKACALTRVGGEDGTKYHAALPYGSNVTIHVADASFLLVTDKKSNYLNDAGVNPFTLTAAELETTLLTDKDEKPFTPAENSKVAYLSIMDAMAGTTYELYLELTREVTPATGVTLDQTELTLTAGKTASLKATVQPENTTDTIVWSSSKEEVATVENGIVTAKAAGETVITATCGTVKAECAVTVTPPVMASAVTLDKTELNLYTGDTAALTAAIQPEDTTDPTIAWTTTDAEVASVQNGVVTAGKTGTATITASCGEAKAQCAVTVKAPAEPAQKDGVYQIGNADELQNLHRALLRVLAAHADDLQRVVDMQNAALNTTGSNGATAGDGHGVLDSHQERLVDVALGGRNVGVNSVHELPNLLLPLGVALEGLQSRATDNRGVVSGETVLGEELTGFHLNELDELFVVDHVALVQEDNDVGNANLTGEQDVLASLSHGAVGSSDNQNSAVHLGSTGDHVLDVVGVAGAVNMSVVTSVGLILDVGNRNGDAALTLFRSLVDHVEGSEVSVCGAVRAVVHGQRLGDSSRQSGFTMVNVTNGTNVHMRLAALELLLSHYSSSVGAFRPLLLHIKTRAQKDACSLQMVAVTGFEPVTPRV